MYSIVKPFLKAQVGNLTYSFKHLDVFGKKRALHFVFSAMKEVKLIIKFSENSEVLIFDNPHPCWHIFLDSKVEEKTSKFTVQVFSNLF